MGSAQDMRRHFKKVVWKDNPEKMRANEELLRNPKVQQQFKGYEFDGSQMISNANYLNYQSNTQLLTSGQNIHQTRPKR